MQKISSYLYPNRVQLLADLAGFTTEYTNVYQRTVKIYSGVDNTIEFDIKNADQKRIDLSTLTSIQMHVMDATGKALACSPYTVTPMNQTTLKGLATVTIPALDMEILDGQFLQYSVVAKKNLADVILYADSRFGALGKIELIKSVIPYHSRPVQIFNSFTGEIDLDGNVINHSSAIPATFYEADITPALQFTIEMTGFIGRIWLVGTERSTISVEAFRHSATLLTQTYITPNSQTLIWANVNVEDFKYFRVYYQGDNPLTPTGSVNRILINSDVCADPFNTVDGGPSEGNALVIDGGAA
jgi:hypothetical protein